MTPKTKEKVGYTPEEIIQMALQGTQSYIDKKDQRAKEEQMYKAARPNPIQEALQARGGGSPTPDPSFGPPPGAPARSGSVQTIAQQMAAEKGWTGAEWDALYDLVRRESSWNPQAANPNSSARGLFQFISSTAQNYGLPRDATQASPEQQIRAGLQYIQDRYQTPSRALQHWLSRVPLNGKDVGNWY